VTAAFLLFLSVPPLLAVQPGWLGPGLQLGIAARLPSGTVPTTPCLTIAYLLLNGAPPDQIFFRSPSLLGITAGPAMGSPPCRGCGGKIPHPSRFLSFRGYDDKRAKPLSRQSWEELRRAVGLSEEELRMAMAISWREDRWRNRRHRNPRAVGLFGQIGGKSPCPVSQLRWAHKYALSRYGSWRAALRHHKKKGWW
jgi:hypothetical protein